MRGKMLGCPADDGPRPGAMDAERADGPPPGPVRRPLDGATFRRAPMAGGPVIRPPSRTDIPDESPRLSSTYTPPYPCEWKRPFDAR
jgi:hypothetical protein